MSGVLKSEHCLPLPSEGWIDFAAPEFSQFTIEDVANGLATKYRFAGQTERWYSVAQHSVILSRLVPPSLALQALWHDAAEAFTADLVKPLKSLCPDFQRVEDRLLEAIFAKMGLPWPIDPEVHRLDKELARVESRVLRSWLHQGEKPVYLGLGLGELMRHAERAVVEMFALGTAKAAMEWICAHERLVKMGGA